MDCGKACAFINSSNSSETTLPVLFEIHADPERVPTQQFADVSAYSKFPGEKEILFMPRSIFRLESIDRGLPGKVSIIRMTLCNDTEHDFDNVFVFMKQQYEDREITLRTVAKILRNMGKLDLAEKYIHRLIEQLPFNDVLLAELFRDIAELRSQAGEFDKSLEWHQKALAIKNHHSLTSQLSIDAASKSVENNSELTDNKIIDDPNVEQRKLSKSAVQMMKTATVNQPNNIVKTSDIQEEKHLTFNVPSNDTVHPICQFRADKSWLYCQFHINNNSIIRPDEIENEMDEPNDSIDENVLNRIQGSMIGLALGDALGALVKDRSHQYLVHHPVTDLQCGGTWNLVKGQFTDNTSMALCLATSLIARRSFILYDQLVRYKWWFRSGYMSSTDQCFAIGESMKQSLCEFERRQEQYANEWAIPMKDMDYLSEPERLSQFDISCIEEGVADYTALVRLAPVPLFFYRFPRAAIIYSGQSGQITHGDSKVYDACRYYGSLIVAALHGYTKEQLLDNEFYSEHKFWFDNIELDPSIESVAKGSYKKNGYDAGIRGTDNIVNALEAALWVFWSDEDSFEKGALTAVNLGGDTDAIAAIYGQLAGAYYGYQRLPQHWLDYIYAKKFMEKLSTWIAYEGECCQKRHEAFVAQLMTNKN